MIRNSDTHLLKKGIPVGIPFQIVDKVQGVALDFS